MSDTPNAEARERTFREKLEEQRLAHEAKRGFCSDKEERASFMAGARAALEITAENYAIYHDLQRLDVQMLVKWLRARAEELGP